MSAKVRFAILLGTSAVLPLIAWSNATRAQEPAPATTTAPTTTAPTTTPPATEPEPTAEPGATELPTVTVTAPTRVTRRRTAPKRVTSGRPQRGAPAQPAPAQPSPPPVVAATPPGTLPIVTDQFGSVTAVPAEEMRRANGGTLGEILSSKPGITGSSFAPGASSRPIIRGLDMNRVRIQENGVGANGASDLGEDHGVPIDPLATDKIEVIRGPGALRFGSQAIGGVVNASNNRIPDASPCPAGTNSSSLIAKAPLANVSPPSCVTVEMRGAATSADNGLEGAILLDAGGKNFAIHADAYGRNGDDYRIPSYPYLHVPGQPFNGKQPNSALRSNGEAIGGSYLFDGGFIGLSVSQFDSLYHVPGLDGAEHNTRIDMTQTKFLSKGEYRFQSPILDTIRFWAGVTDYKHNEIGLGDPSDPSSDGIQQTFTNKEQEARVEAKLQPFDLRFAAVTSTIGVQGWHQDLTAPGGEPGPFSGLFDPNNTTTAAAYMFHEFKFDNQFRMQLSGRIENDKVEGSVPDLITGATTPIGRNLSFTPKSAAIGFLKDLPWNMVASLTAQYVERAPRAAELLSRGPHDATGTFDIGNPNLGIEAAKSIEIGLKRSEGPFRFEASAYYTKFSGFIYRRLTGETCDETPDTCSGAPFGGAGGELNQAVYSQRDATFRGAEFQSQYDVMPLWAGTFGIENQFDVVRATFSDGTNVPRIPPVRVGGGAYWRDDNWLARVNLLHAFSHKETAPQETPTDGYNLLKAELSYHKKLRPAGSGDGVSEFTVGITGDNLLNEDIRNSVSYTKDEVLLPGRSVRVFANVKY